MTLTLMGQLLDGRYRLDAPIGAGAMGEVYRGMQVSLMRQVAVKVLPRRMVGQSDLVQRFEREAQLLSRLKHPGIVSVIDFGWSAGRPYLVMELVEGQSLEQLLGEDGKLPVDRVGRVLVELCDALDHAHAMGVLHRDLKPSNILIEYDHVRVVDFGVARALEHGNANITGEGMVLGTPKYCSPEQAMGLSLDGRSDLYALGIVAWRMITGKVPFDGEGPAAIFSRHVLEVPPPLAQVAGLTGEWRALGAVVDRMLAKSPGDRYPSALEASRALQAIVGAPPAEAPRITIPASPRAIDANEGVADTHLPDGRLLPPLDAPFAVTGDLGHDAPRADAVAPGAQLARPEPVGPADAGLGATEPPRVPALPPGDLGILSRDTAPIRTSRRSAPLDHPTVLDPPGAGVARGAVFDEHHDTLLDDIARPRSEVFDTALDDSGFAPTARAIPRPGAKGAEPRRSWIDRHPGVSAALVIALIGGAAWMFASTSSPDRPSRGAVVLPPLAAQARTLIGQGEARTAVERLETAVEETPRDPALRVALGHAYVRGGRAQEAIPHYVWAARQSTQVFDDEHAADLAALADAADTTPLARLELERARERLGEPGRVLTAARDALSTSKCDDRKAAIKLLREREDTDVVPLLEPLGQSKGCGALEAKKAVEALSAR